MTVRDGFAIFVLTHGRPEFLAHHTASSLKASRYTGPWYIVLDDEDPTIDGYAELFGEDRIRTFHKGDTDVDMGDNGGPAAVVVYARNAVDRIAADLGLTWTLQLDDDYNNFHHRFIDGDALRGVTTRRLDEIIEFYLDFLTDTGALTVAFAQGGDFAGGATGRFQHTRVKRKAMNSFFTRVGRPVRFVGRINEDTTAYVASGAVGELFLTAKDFGLTQEPTQLAPGGLTDAYKQLGTYVKSFYSVLFAPSAVRVSIMGSAAARIHHAVLWNYAVPKIISDQHRKALG